MYTCDNFFQASSVHVICFHISACVMSVFPIIMTVHCLLSKDFALLIVILFNHRMKQQLICELVKSGNDADLMNKQYEVKIRALEMVRKMGICFLLSCVTYSCLHGVMLSAWICNLEITGVKFSE